MGPLGTNFSEITGKSNYDNFQWNKFENAVGKMMAILSMPQWV